MKPVVSHPCLYNPGVLLLYTRQECCHPPAQASMKHLASDSHVD